MALFGRRKEIWLLVRRNVPAGDVSTGFEQGNRLSMGIDDRPPIQSSRMVLAKQISTSLLLIRVTCPQTALQV